MFSDDCAKRVFLFRVLDTSGGWAHGKKSDALQEYVTHWKKTGTQNPQTGTLNPKQEPTFFANLVCWPLTTVRCSEWLRGGSQVCRKNRLRLIKFPISIYSLEVEQQDAEACGAYCIYQCLKAVQVSCIPLLQSPASQSYISFVQENYLVWLNSSCFIKRRVLERSFLLSLRHTGKT